jgi:hypothetical protein
MLFELTKETLLPIAETQFHKEGIYERADLQRLLRADISVLSDDLMVLAQEFGNWEDSNRRIDLLCLDTDARLVVVEIKRTEDGGHMELQAIRYAAMVSAMSFDDAVDAYANDRALDKITPEQARADILKFLDWDTPDNGEFAAAVRIILVSADFSKELTTSVIWLNDQGLDLRCIRFRPYRLAEGRLLLNVEQILPLPEATEYQTQIRAKEQSTGRRLAERHQLRLQFWTALLAQARTKTTLHANRKPGIYNWIGGSLGRAGLSLTYATREDDSTVEVYIDFGESSDEKNLQVFEALKSHRGQIEEVFGEPLEWQDLPDKRACRIRKIVAGGYRSPQEQWPEIHDKLIDAMIRLDKAVRPFVQQLPI